MRDRRKLHRFLVATPLLVLATGGVVYLASNTVAPSYAGVTTFHVHCTATPTPTCTTTATP